MIDNSNADYRPSFAIDSFINFSAQFSLFCLSILSSILIARVLGPEGKGVYSLSILVLTMTSFLISMGMNSANIYFIGKRKYSIERIAGNSLSYSICIGCVFSILLLILIPLIRRYFFKDIHPLCLYLIIPMIPFVLISDNINYILLAYRKMIKLSGLRILRQMAYLAMLTIFLFFAGLTVSKAIVAYILGLFSALILGFIFLFKDKYLTGLFIDKEFISDSVKFGLKQHLGGIFQLLNYRVDMLIIAVLLTPTDLGFYSISVLMAETLWYVPSTIGQILFVKTSSEDTTLIKDFTPLVCRTVILITATACIVLYFISGALIPWFFTSKFLPSVSALKLLLPGVLFLSIAKILGNDLTGRGFPQYSSFATGVALIATIIFDLLLIPKLGIRGASIASSLSYLTSTCIIISLFIKTAHVKLSDLLFIRITDLSIYNRIARSLLNNRMSLRID